jgi:superfamily I DNA and RNA helicase
MVTHTNKLQRRSRQLMEALGIVDLVRTKVKAFDRLQTRLLEMRGVEAVAVRGFAKSSRTVNSESGGDVSVIFAKYPDAELQRDTERIFSEINRRHGTTMAPVIICRETLDPA